LTRGKRLGSRADINERILPRPQLERLFSIPGHSNLAEKNDRPAPEHANDHIHVAASLDTLTRCALLHALKQTPGGPSQYDGSHPPHTRAPRGDSGLNIQLCDAPPRVDDPVWVNGSVGYRSGSICRMDLF
jgi:hypothetical protein